MKLRNVLLSFGISIPLAILCVIAYEVIPFFWQIFRQVNADGGTAGSSGIAVVAGGVSVRLTPVFLLAEILMFTVVYMLLQRRRIGR